MKKKYKILYFDLTIPQLLSDASQPIGGAAVEWHTWLKAFKKIGCDCGVLTWKGAKKIITKNSEYDIVESYDLNKGIPKVRFLSYQLPLLITSIKKYNPDFIAHESADKFAGILAFISQILRIPFIHRIASDMDVDERIKNNISKNYLKLYNYGVKHANHISCQNKYQYEVLIKKFPQKSISILYNPFEPSDNINLNKEKKYIAWVGNFRFEKNMPALAEIVKALPGYQFKVAGMRFNNTDSDSEIGLNLLSKLPNVEFVGYLKNENIPNFLSQAYCLLNTSRLEGFSNTFLESWSVGVPVISTKNVNPDNIIKDYDLGLVSPDYAALPKIITDFIENKYYETFEKKCINYVKEKHNAQYLAAQFLDDMINCTKQKKSY